MIFPIFKKCEYMKEVDGKTTLMMSDAGMCRALAALALAARMRGYGSTKIDEAAADLSRQVMSKAVGEGNWEGCTEKRGDVENLLEAIANNGEKETSATMIYDDEE